MADVNIFCSFQQSNLNPNLYVCQHCGNVVDQKNYHPASLPMCPVLTDVSAMNPDVNQVKLAEVAVSNDGGKTFVSVTKDTQPTAILEDWWFYKPFGGNALETKPPRPQQYENDNQNRKQCTQAQIDERLKICHGCEFYKNNTCLKCGCVLSREKTYMNKLLWADQKCPVEKWGPIPESTDLEI